jgi:hypothetical protein
MATGMKEGGICVVHFEPFLLAGIRLHINYGVCKIMIPHFKFGQNFASMATFEAQTSAVQRHKNYDNYMTCSHYVSHGI